MILAFLNLGTPEIVMIIIALLISIALGNYGKNTVLGYWGSILLSILTTPVVAFVIISVLIVRKAATADR